GSLDPDAEAAGGPEEVVVPELDVPPHPYGGVITSAQLQMPGLLLGYGHVDVGEGRRSGPERIDAHGRERRRLLESLLGGGETIRVEHIAGLDAELPPDGLFLRDKEAAHEDSPDMRRGAFRDVVQDGDLTLASIRPHVDGGAVEATPAVEPLHAPSPVLGAGGIPGIARPQGDDREELLAREHGLAVDADVLDGDTRTFGDGNHHVHP